LSHLFKQPWICNICPLMQLKGRLVNAYHSRFLFQCSSHQHNLFLTSHTPGRQISTFPTFKYWQNMKVSFW
jgi:hypothetical protein